MNLVNLEHHQLVAECHPNLEWKFSYLKDLEDMDPFNICGVYAGKDSDQLKGGVDVTAVITYKTPFVLNGKLMTVSFALVEEVACNTIFPWPLLQTIKASIMTNNNALVIRLLGKQFRLEMMVPQRAKESPKTSEGHPVSLPVAIQEKQDNMEYRGSRNSMVDLKKTVIDKRQIPGQH